MQKYRHTTNYYNTFIEVADDCKIKFGEVPPEKPDKKTVANMQFDILRDQPYQYTSDDILFRVHTMKNNINERDDKVERELFFSKGQPCFRASPLTKRYGWGIHFNEEGKMAMYAMDEPEYKRFLKDKKVDKIKAMRSSKK